MVTEGLVTLEKVEIIAYRSAPKQEELPSTNKPLEAPWPVQKGGVVLKLYENSLALAFVLLFLGSFFMHASGGAVEYSAERLAHGQSAVSIGQYLKTSQFWFESLQNWQSEFLAVAAIVLLSIVLRQKGSPESKPVDASYAETGT